KQTEATGRRWPAEKLDSEARDVVSNRRTMLSWLATATRFPSGARAITLTWASGPRSEATSRPVRASVSRSTLLTWPVSTQAPCPGPGRAGHPARVPMQLPPRLSGPGRAHVPQLQVRVQAARGEDVPVG